MEKILRDIKRYVPVNMQEEKDKELMISFLETAELPLSRDNLQAHMTVSAWVVNRQRNKVFMCYHNIYDSWSWLGGHADGEKNLAWAALKEVTEESGLENIWLADKEIFSLEILTVDGHIKRGEYVSSHLHMNVTYLVEGSEDEELKVKEDENSGLRWIPFEEVKTASSEKWFVENIYSKLIEKVRKNEVEKRSDMDSRNCASDNNGRGMSEF